MIGTLCRWICGGKYAYIVECKNKVDRYNGHLSAIETQLNDLSRKLIASVRGFIDVEKCVNKSSIKTLSGFLTTVQQLYPKVYSSEEFRRYEYQLIKLEQDIRHEKQVINKFVSYYNIALDRSPILSKIWKFEKIDIIKWNVGRNTEVVGIEFNKLNSDLVFK